MDIGVEEVIASAEHKRSNADLEDPVMGSEMRHAGEASQSALNVMAAKSAQALHLRRPFNSDAPDHAYGLENNASTPFTVAETLPTVGPADQIPPSAPPLLHQFTHEPPSTRNAIDTSSLPEMAKGSDGSFRPNNNLNRNPLTHQRVYGKGTRHLPGSWLEDTPSVTLASTGGSGAGRDGGPYKKRKTSHNVSSTNWNGRHDTSDGQRTRLANRLGVDELIDGLRAGTRAAEDQHSTPLGSINEYKQVDNMMKPNSQKTRRASTSSPSRKQLASSQDELQSPLRSTAFARSPTLRATRLDHGMAPRESARSYSVDPKFQADDSLDEIVDHEQDRTIAPRGRNGANTAMRSVNLEVHPARRFLPGSKAAPPSDDELQRDHPEQAFRDLRPTSTASKSEHEAGQSGARSRSASPISLNHAVDERSETEEELRPTAFTKSGRNRDTAASRSASFLDSNKFVKTFALQSFWSLAKNDINNLRLAIFLDPTKNPMSITLRDNRNNNRWTRIPIGNPEYLVHSPETARMFLRAPYRQGHKPYWCQFLFIDKSTHRAFYDALMQDAEDTKIICKSDREVHDLVSKARSGSLDEELSVLTKGRQARNVRSSSSSNSVASGVAKPKKISRMLDAPSTVSTRTRASRKIEDDDIDEVQGRRKGDTSPNANAMVASERSTSHRPTPLPLQKSQKPNLGRPWTSALVFPEKGSNKATVAFDDLYRLEEEDMLNDNLISFCLRYAQEKAPASSKRVYIFSSFFYEVLTSGVPKQQKVNYDAVRKWTNKVALFDDYDYVVVPINESFHWYAAIICNTTRFRRVDVQDLTNDDDETFKSSAQASDGPTAQDKILSDDVPSDRVASDRVASDRVAIGEANADSGDDAIARETARLSIDEVAASARPSNNGRSHPQELVDLSASTTHSGPGKWESRTASAADRAEKTDSSSKDVPRSGNSASSRRTDKRSALRKRDPLEPAIILLDSMGTPHNQTTAKLKEYLDREVVDKKKFQVELPGGNNERRLPAQQNLSDCGVYLIGYITKFLNDPAGFVEKQAQGTLAEDPEWKRLDPSVMRNNIREVILNEHRAQMAAKSSKSASSAEQVRSSREHPPILSTAYHEFTESKSNPDDRDQQSLEPDKGAVRQARSSLFEKQRDQQSPEPDQDAVRQARSSLLEKQRENTDRIQEHDGQGGPNVTKEYKTALEHFLSDPLDPPLDSPQGTKRKTSFSSDILPSSPPTLKRVHLDTHEPSGTGGSSEDAQVKSMVGDKSAIPRRLVSNESLTIASEAGPANSTASATALLSESENTEEHMQAANQRETQDTRGQAQTSKARNSCPIVIEDSQDNDVIAVESVDKARSSSPISRDRRKRPVINQGVIDLEESMRQTSARQARRSTPRNFDSFIDSVEDYVKDYAKQSSEGDRSPPQDREDRQRS